MKTPLTLIILFTFSGCVGSPYHKTITYNHIQKTIKENNAALLELKAGMSQSEVSNIIGESERTEGYTWGNVWFYRTAMSDIYGTTDSDFTPVIFDQNDILLGWGHNYFTEILRNEVSEISGSDTTQSQGPISSTTTGSPEPKANTRTEDYGREREREVLAGLQGVYVLVEGFSPEEEKYGFNRQQYKTDVELRLRQFGVKVLSKKESYKVSGSPYLYINVNPIIDEEIGVAAVSISVKLKELVLSRRNPSTFTISTTWQEGMTLLYGLNKLDSVREKVRDLVDEFINDYLAANPKDSIPKTIQQTYVVPKNALIDMIACAALFQVAINPNRPQERKDLFRNKGLELMLIQLSHIAMLGIKPEDYETRMSILEKRDIKDMPPEFFDYINFEDFLNTLPKDLEKFR